MTNRTTLLATTCIALLAIVVGIYNHIQDDDDNKTKLNEAKCNESILHNTDYNLIEIDSPIVSGVTLQVFAKILQTPIIGLTVLGILKKQNNIGSVQCLAMALTETNTNTMIPLYYPLPEYDGKNDNNSVWHDENRMADRFDFEKFVQKDYYSPKSSSSHDSSTKFRYWTVYDYVKRYKDRTLTPFQVAQWIIRTVDESNQLDPPLKAVITISTNDLLQQAIASTERYKTGNTLGILDGVPIAVKDEIDVAGYTTTFGTLFLQNDTIKDVDAYPIAKLRAVGAMIIGKTNMHEIGLGTTGHNAHYGPTRNPYNVKHYSGGSSGGSASAVAAGIVPIAIGFDGGGSVRIPAALCGVVGIKPTFQRIAANCHVAPTVGHMGPIAATVADTAIAYTIMSGPHPTDVPHSIVQPNVHLYDFDNYNLTGLKIGVYKKHWEHSSIEIQQETQRILQHLLSLGAEAVDITIPHMQEVHLAHSITILSEMVQSQSIYHHRLREYSYESQISLSLARSLSNRDYIAAQKVRRYAMQVIQDIFRNNVDIILSPTTAMTAPEIPLSAVTSGESNLAQTAALMRYIIHGNFLGIPGISIPVGYDTKGLPISVQFQSNHYRESLLFRVAHACESIVQRKKPELFYSIESSL